MSTARIKIDMYIGNSVTSDLTYSSFLYLIFWAKCY